MGSKIIKNVCAVPSTDTESIDNNKSKWAEYKVLVCFSGFFLLFAIATILIFLGAIDWKVSWKADVAQWGLYGDFIGGIFGVGVVVVSTYYLVETLKDQKTTNEKVTKANTKIVNLTYLQQIDTKYKHLIKQYEKLKEKNNKEKQTLHDKVKLLIKNPIDTSLNYGERNRNAYHIFDNLCYIPNREILSVQFRILYQLYKLIDGIEDWEKDVNNASQVVLYAKLVRCQLNEDELFLIRYNCYCTYGEKMRQYVNKYNLLKHLPILSLIEFQFWSEHVFTDDLLKNAIDTEFIKQKKFISTYVSEIHDTLPIGVKISDRYEIQIQLNKEKTNFVYVLIYHEDIESRESIDYAFDLLLPNNYMLDFLDDYLHELFEYANFQLYNKGLSYHSHVDKDKDRKTTAYIINVESSSSLVLKNQDLSKEILPIATHPIEGDTK